MSDYWERRKAQQMFEYMAGAEETADAIAQLYLKASRHISLELDQIFERYQRKHKLSEAEARRLLNRLHDKSSLDELKRLLQEGEGDKKALLAELESPAYQARMERLQQLQNQVDLTMQQVYQQEKVQNTSWYLDLANESYYRSIFDIQKQTGLAFGFSLVSPEAIDRVINSRWSGANYSERIWRNTQGMAQTLKEELLLSLVTGRTDRETADIISNKFATSASNARRLVRTESCNLTTQMDMESYSACGVKKYRYVATLDMKTSDACRALDGKVFPVSEQQPGKNCPPMHPWCRSTTIMDMSSKELAGMKRAARDPVTGKTMKVPADMTYEQWYEKYVSGRPEAELNEKKIRNRSADRTQYKKYRDSLGKENVPESLSKFQDIKYGTGDGYGIMKAQHRGMSYYNKAVQAEPEVTKHVLDVAKRTGMEPMGVEHRVKSKNSYLEKIRRRYDPAGNSYEVKDILRYTYTAPPEQLVDKARKSIDLHRQKGYNTTEVKNYWLDRKNPYNGINTVMRGPNGQPFELQYHTAESYSVKDSMHKDYEEWRAIEDKSSAEAIALRKRMSEQSGHMKVPARVEEIK